MTGLHQLLDRGLVTIQFYAIGKVAVMLFKGLCHGRIMPVGGIIPL